MPSNQSPQFIPASDRTILAKFGEEISKDIHRHVFSFTQFVLNNKIKGVANIHPAYASVLFFLELNANLDETLQKIKKSWLTVSRLNAPKSRNVEVPVCYGGDLGPDLDRVSRHTGLDKNEIIQRHQSGNYLVYFTGFSPGFPYIAGMDPALRTPRLTTPRKLVPAGSIGIAHEQTGIYPLASPGGWNLIGQTPLEIFDRQNPGELKVRMGDSVTFNTISKNEFERLKKNGS